MNNLFKQARTRLRDTRGFMLAEQMVAVVILGFLCLAIAAGLGVCISVQRDISAETTAQSLLSHAVQEVDDQLEFSLDVHEGESAFVSSTMHQKVVLSSSPSEGIVLTQVDSPSSKTLLAGENGGMIPVFADGGLPAYNASANAWEYTISIVDGSNNVVKTQTVAVKRVCSAASTD